MGENVEYGLKIKKVAKDERRRRAAEALELVRLGGYETGARRSSPAASASAWPWPARS